MAFKKSLVKQPIKVVARYDEALDIGEDFEEIYEKYLETLNENLLTFKEGAEPTRFVLKRQFDWKTGKDLKNESIKTGKKGRAEIQAGAYMETIRYALIGIENPEGAEDALEWEADRADSRKTAIHVMECLPDRLIIDLNSARDNVVNPTDGELLKKK